MSQPLTAHAFAFPPNTSADLLEMYLRLLLGDEFLVQMMYQQITQELLCRAAALPPRLPTPGWAHHSLPMAPQFLQGLPSDTFLTFPPAGQLFTSQPRNVAEPVDAIVAGMANVAIAPEMPALEPLDRSELPPQAAAGLSAGPSRDWQDFGLSGTFLDEIDASMQLGYVDHASWNASSSFRPSVQRLEQGTYRACQSIRGTSAGPMLFGGGAGVLLSAIDTLANGDMPAFDRAASIGEKSSMRFELSGFTDHSTQVRVRHGGKSGEPVTLRRVAELVREQLQNLMNHAESVGKPLRYRGCLVPFGKIVLLRVDHISKGSIQPILGILDDG